MKNKFTLIFLLLLFFPIILNAGSEEDKVEICNKGINNNNYLYSKLENPVEGSEATSTQIIVYDFFAGEDQAYCIQPGKAAAGVRKCRTYTLQKDFINEDCKSSKDGFECGLAAILGHVNDETIAEENNYDYISVLTALRLWTAAKSPEAISGDGLWSETNPTKKTYIYKTTKDELNNNREYNGFARKESGELKEYAIGLLYSTPEMGMRLEGEFQIEKAFKLYRLANEDGIDVFVANIKPEKEEYKFEEDGTATVRLITNFNAETEDVVVTSTEVEIVSVETVGECGENQYCYDVKVSIDDINRCDEIIAKFNVKYKDSRDVLSHVKKYETNNRSYQTFIVYDKDADAGEKEIKVKFICHENDDPGDKCPYTGIITTGSTICSDTTDTNEYTISDPELCTVMNMVGDQYRLEEVKYNVLEEEKVLCSVYCREKILFRFMGKKSAIAGRTFKYNVQGDTLREDNKFITAVVAERQCVSKNIKYDQWKTDYEKLNQKLIEAWNEFKKWKARKNNEIEHNENKTCRQCGCDRCWVQNGTIQVSSMNPLTGEISYSDVPSWEYKDNNCRLESEMQIHWYEWKNADYTITNLDGTTSPANADGNSGSRELTQNCEGVCPNTVVTSCTFTEGESAEAKMNEAKGTFLYYKEQIEEMIKKLPECNYEDGTTIYNKINEYEFKTTTHEVEYDDPFSEHIEIESQQGPGDVSRKYRTDNGDWTDICPGGLPSGCTADVSQNITGTLQTENLDFWTCEEEATTCSKTQKPFAKSKAAYIAATSEEAYYQNAQFDTQIGTGIVEKHESALLNTVLVEDESNQKNYLYPLERDKEDGEYDIWEKFTGINEDFREELVKFPDITFECIIDVCNETTLNQQICPLEGEASLEIKPNGGIWNGSSIDQSFNDKTGATKNVDDPTKEGSVFIGWEKSSPFNGSFANKVYTYGVEKTKDILTAQWQESGVGEKSKLIINPNGGAWNGSYEVQEFEGETNTIKDIPNPTRSEHVFKGWNKSSPFNGTFANKVYTFGDEANTIDTLTATWERSSCSWETECCGEGYEINPNCPPPEDCDSDKECCEGDVWPYNKFCLKPSTSLGFIFRPIEMNNIFPNDRTRGRNWNTAEAQNIKDAIEDNSTNFWTTVTPQYSVTITPENIRNIKSYNKSQTEGYFNYTLVCESDGSNINPSKCRSTFLDNIVENNYATRIIGRDTVSDQDSKGNSYIWKDDD